MPRMSRLTSGTADDGCSPALQIPALPKTCNSLPARKCAALHAGHLQEARSPWVLLKQRWPVAIYLEGRQPT